MGTSRTCVDGNPAETMNIGFILLVEESTGDGIMLHSGKFDVSLRIAKRVLKPRYDISIRSIPPTLPNSDITEKIRMHSILLHQTREVFNIGPQPRLRELFNRIPETLDLSHSTHHPRHQSIQSSPPRHIRSHRFEPRLLPGLYTSSGDGDERRDCLTTDVVLFVVTLEGWKVLVERGPLRDEDDASEWR